MCIFANDFYIVGRYNKRKEVVLMKTIAITGASGILCREFSISLAKSGHKIALIARNTDKLKELESEIVSSGYIAKSYTADVTDSTQINAIHNAILKDFGPCDILINGAGGNHPLASTKNEYHTDNTNESELNFFNLKQEGFSQVFDINLWGTVLPCQVFAKDMIGRKGCCILNISSMAAFSPLTKTPAYCAAKAGISNFTQWLAVHLAPAGIRVNAIAPGFFLTQQNHHLLFEDDGTPAPRADKILNNTPMGRFGKPQELIGALNFLLDEDKASFVTGCILPVDGGFSAYSGV